MCQFFSAEQTVRRWAPLGRLPALIVAKFSARQKLWKDIFDSTTRKASLIATLVTENNFHLTRNSLMSPWPVRMVRWWKPTKWSWLAPVTNKPSLAGKGWGFLKCFGRTEECWHQNWVYAGFLLATLYTSWTVWGGVRGVVGKRPDFFRIFFLLPSLRMYVCAKQKLWTFEFLFFFCTFP